MNQQRMELNPRGLAYIPNLRIHVVLVETHFGVACYKERSSLHLKHRIQSRRNLMWGLARRVYGPLSLTIMRDVVEKVASSRSIMPRE